MWGKLYWCVWAAQRGPTGKSLNPQRSSAGHWGGLIKGHLSPTMCGGAGWSWWGSPPRGTEFMALVNKGSPGQRDRRGLCARDFVHTRWRVNSLPIPHPSLAIPPNNHLLQRSCTTQCHPTPLLLLSITVGTMRGTPPPHHHHHPSAPPRPPNRHFFYWNSLVF